jgi:hypothetical protein
MKALRNLDRPTFLPLPHILTHTETELLRQNTLLRDHVALLVSTNVDLLRQIEDLSSRNPLTRAAEVASNRGAGRLACRRE